MSWGVSVKGGAQEVSDAFDKTIESQRAMVASGGPEAELADINNAQLRAVEIANNLPGEVDVSAGGSWNRPYVDGQPGEWERSSFYLNVKAVI